MEASADVVINGAPGPVWATIWDPVSSRLLHPERIAWSGQVPGTPTRKAGEMQYFVNRHPGGRFTASVLMVTELADGHRAVTRQLGRPLEIVHIVTPVPGGTRLELTYRLPARKLRGRDESRHVLEKMRAELRRSAESYRLLIEGPKAQTARPPAADPH
jgi:hypothetical protein